MERLDLTGEAPRNLPADRKRIGGSVVTYAVAGFMLVALLFYLTVAFFADDPGAEAPAPDPSAAESKR